MELKDSISLVTESYSPDSEDYSQSTYSLPNCSLVYDLVLVLGEDDWPPCSWWDSEFFSSDPCALDDISCNNVTSSGVRGVTSSSSSAAHAHPSSWQSSPFRKWQIALIGIFAGCVSLLTIVGNVIVLLSFILHRNIRQTSNYFIASLAVSDLLIGTISMPLYTVYFLSGKSWPLGETPCDLWLALDYTVCLCSIYTVFCITVDRFCSVTHPATYQAWRTDRKVVLVLVLVWSVPTFVFFTSIIGWQYIVRRRTVPDGKCYVQYMENALFNCLLQVGYFWVTLTAMCALYGGIYRVALRLNHRARSRRKRMESLVSIAGETITKIGISVSKSPVRGRKADGVDGAAEWYDGEVEREAGGEERRDEAGDKGGSGRERRGNVKRSSEARESQESREGENNLQTHSSPLGQLYHPVSSHQEDDFWEEVETEAHAFKGKRCLRPSSTEERERVRDPKVRGQHRVSVQRSSRRCLARKAFDNITRAMHSTRTRRQPLVFYDATELPSSSDEDYTENGDKEEECHHSAAQNTSTDLGPDAELVQLRKDVDASVEPGFTLKRTIDAVDRKTRNESTRGHFKADHQSSTHRSSQEKTKSKKNPDNESSGGGGGSRRSVRSRTLSDRILMRGGSAASVAAEQKRRTTRLRTKRANCVARKSLRTITLILGAFVLCWTPWHVLSLIMGFCSGQTPAACVPSELYDVSYWLCYLNSCINPFCYALANQQFKKAFLRILRLDWRRT